MLTDEHRAHLAGSAISPEIVEARGYVSIAPGSMHDWRELAGETHKESLLKQVLHKGALAFPLYRCGEERPHTWVLRPEQPRCTKEGKPIKYEYPRGATNVFDCLPAYREALKDPTIDLWLTEGAKKADALASAYGSSIVPVNENGVWGWRSKGRALPDIDRIVWEGRRVIIAPDGDTRHNKSVRQAVERAAQLLKARGAGEVIICLLPAPPDQPTMGVDDYLAAGHTPADLESHFIQLEALDHQARVHLCQHPETGAKLYLPPGYDVQNKTLARHGTGTFYRGVMLVTRTGRNLHTGEETATVLWNGRGAHHQIDMLRSDMASSAGCTRCLGSAGAAIHASNAKTLSTYLVEFIQENYDHLPRRDYTDRLGAVGNGLVLPAGQVGLDQEVVYTGPEIKVGDDPHAYHRVLREIAIWDKLAPLWGVFALTLAGPALSRLKPERNPVIYLAGSSGSGKTTLAHFAAGVYGDPTKAPLQIQCGSGSTTRVGIQQTLTTLNGVPVFLDDAHMLWQRRQDVVEGAIYDFANAQLRTYGGLKSVQGGQQLGGVLLMAGEMVPEFAHAGSQRRTLVIDCKHRLPLGRMPRSREGEQRAHAIRAAWQRGAGLFGLAVNERIWADWGGFTADVAALATDPALAQVQAWRQPLATACVVLRLAAQEVGSELDTRHLLKEWAAMYTEMLTQSDPALEAFDRIQMMLAQCECVENLEGGALPTWRWLMYDKKMVAAQRIGETHWRVLTTSPQWKSLIGAGMVDQFGDTWLEHNLVLPFANGKVSYRTYTGKGYFQCIQVPHALFYEDPTS